MKNKILLFSAFLLFANFVNAQNQPPVAVNDTVWALYNTKKIISVKINDVDPEGGKLRIDTVLYTGDAIITYSSSSVSPASIKYTGAVDFFGKDSLRYVIRDDGDPIMYDTAWVFINVRLKHFDFLDINNINAYLGKDGNIFFNKSSIFEPGFEVPAGSGNHSIFAVSPRLVGNVGSLNKYHVFRFNNSFVPYAGPIMDEQWYSEYDEKWDRLWKVNRSDIEYHINHWADNNYEPIEVIVNWPAHGNTDKGQAFYLAPFFDNNSDGIYNPIDGDFPKIKGDQAIFIMYNILRPHVIALQNNIEIDDFIPEENRSTTEVHALFYAFECDQDSALYHTIFANIKFINRSEDLYDSTYVGIWADLDIGNANDDFIECDVDRNSFFGYNGFDFDAGSSGGTGYESNLAAQSVTFLKGVKMDNDGEDNAYGIGESESINGLNFGDGIVDNEYWGMNHFLSGHDPTIFPDDFPLIGYYNYLKSKWADGTPVTYGGSGGDPWNSMPARFFQPGNSDTYFYGTGGVEVADWSDITEGNQPSDRRGISSTGPFTLLPFDTAEVDIAFVFGRDYTGSGNLAPIPIMKERIDSIRSYYLSGETPCGSFAVSVNEIENTESSFFSVYPNPFADFITLDNQSRENMEIVIYNLLGKELLRQNIPVGKTRINLSQIKDNALIIKAVSDDRFEAKKLLRVK
jgi:hypothetical protein